MIRKALGLSFMVGVVSVFAFACGDDDGESGPKYPTSQSFCAAKAQIECSTGSVGVCGVAAAACQQKRTETCVANGNATGRPYTPANAEACLNLVKDAFANPNDATKYKNYIDTCQKVYAGSLTKGQTCNSEYACSGTLICDLVKPTARCADKSAPKAENDGCANSGDVCATGLYCDVSSGEQLCKKRHAINDTCGATIPCVENAFCNGFSCKALAEGGASCADDKECATGFCNKALATPACAGRQFPSETSDCKDFRP